MSYWENRKKKKYEKQKDKVRKKLSIHLFSVSAAEQNTPTHWKLKETASQEEKERYREHRMRLRKKWIDKFFECHPDIDPRIRSELRKEAYEDADIFYDNLQASMK